MTLETNLEVKILLVDDDITFMETTELFLNPAYRVFKANTVARAQQILSTETIDTVVCDLDFKGQPRDGLFLLDWIFEHHPGIPLLVLSGDSLTERVINASRRKLVDFIPKGSDCHKNLNLGVERALLARRNYQTLKIHPDRYKTKCQGILKTLESIDRLAPKGGSVPFLITGETGTGKEFMAKHLAGVFKKRLIAANMASFGAETAESELYGHLKGSFTGAHCNKVGLIEKAHKGMFFLDELGDCPLPVQIKLLRTLDTGEVRTQGSTEVKKLEIQFIGATNRDLFEMMRAGQFRRDLYERVSSFTIHLPPLRERIEDIGYYLNLFLADFVSIDEFTVTPGGLEAAQTYRWPGNARELWKFAQKTVLSYSKRVIDEQAVEEWTKSREHERGYSLESSCSDRDRLIRALSKTDGNRIEAAELLRMNPSTIHRKMRQFGLHEAFAGKPGRPGKARQDGPI